MFVFSKSRASMWYKLYQVQKGNGGLVLMAPRNHEQTWDQGAMWELNNAISGLGVDAEDKDKHSRTTLMQLNPWRRKKEMGQASRVWFKTVSAKCMYIPGVTRWAPVPGHSQGHWLRLSRAQLAVPSAGKHLCPWHPDREKAQEGGICLSPPHSSLSDWGSHCQPPMFSSFRTLPGL